MKYINGTRLITMAQVLRPQFYQGKGSLDDLRDVVDAMEEIPPDQIRFEAEWIPTKDGEFECSHCYGYPVEGQTKFCPHCGYKMKWFDID